MHKPSENDHQHRTVITGIGIVSPLGIGKQEFWRNLENNISGVRPATLFSAEKSYSKGVCEIQAFAPEEILGRKGLRLLDRATKIVLSASKLALEDSGLSVEQNCHRMGVVVGTTLGSLDSRVNFLFDALSEGPRAVNPALFPNTVVNSPASQVSIKFGIKGFNATLSNGNTSAIEAMEYAAGQIAADRADTVLVGGLEELNEIICCCAAKGDLLALDPANGWGPFASTGNGTVLGEGAAMLILEDRQKAINRGAHIYAEYKGSCSEYDSLAYNKYNQLGSGLIKSAKKVLKENNLHPEEVGLIVSGANGIRECDAGEQRLLEALFKENQVVSVPKYLLGETASASGAFSIVTGLLAFEENIIPAALIDQGPGQEQTIKSIANPGQNKIENILISLSSPHCKSTATVISKYGN